MTKQQYKDILQYANHKVLDFLNEAMIDEIGHIAEVYDTGMSLADWEDLQEAIEELRII